MTIQFYLDNNEETHINTMFNMQSNPFKVGDIINLSVGDLKSDIMSDEYVEQHKIKRNLFHLKEIKLIKESKYLNIQSDRLDIEYKCEFV